MVVMRDIVDSPTPVRPAPYGLLSPATEVIVDSDPHWRAGFAYHTSGFIGVENYSPEDPEIRDEVVSGDGDFSKEYVPFDVEVSFTASSFGQRPGDIRQLVEMYIEAATQKAVEREFWTGAISKAITDPEHPNRYLAHPDATDISPSAGAVKTKYGLALLEQALGDSGLGERGTVHVTRGVASALGFKGSNGRLETPTGNFIVAGTGYTGSDPAGTETTGAQAWMYATGPVTVRLSPPELGEEDIRQAVNLKNNTITYTGYRTAAVTWNNESHFAVLVDLEADYS